MSRRPFERTVPRATWYLDNARYRAYMLRELTCILVAVYCVLTMIALATLLVDQPGQWDELLASQKNPAWVVFHTFSLVFFTLYQTVAWFRLAPKAMPLQLGDKAVPASVIVAAHYLGWALLTVIVFWMAGVF